MNISRSFSRHTYHTDVKIMARLDILPDSLRHTIPKANISRWKREDHSRDIGYDALSHNDIATVVRLARHTYFIRKAAAFFRMKDAAITILRNLTSSLTKANLKKIVVATVQRVKDIIGLARAARYFKITVSTFYAWAHEVASMCALSVLDRCPRV
ncbi:MAG: hypothetical protein HZC28_18570 [Spirochaetes bacterium]|nr:hypothetical protein [Spirochaetota bacterium]